MSDTNEVRALKASFRGAREAATALAALQEKVDALDDRGDISEEDLELLGRVTAGHAVAAQALRGLVVTMRNRRSAAAS
jgi:hypothetical protein